MDLATRLEQLLTPLLLHRGLELVRAQLSGQHRPTLQVMIDRLDQTTVTIEDCVGASREISALLDVEDPIPSSYELEVTSPGLDRPLIKVKDFQRFKDHAIKVELHTPREGRKKFKGILQKAEETYIELLPDDCVTKTPLKIDYSDLRKAKLDPA